MKLLGLKAGLASGLPVSIFIIVLRVVLHFLHYGFLYGLFLGAGLAFVLFYTATKLVVPILRKTPDDELTKSGILLQTIIGCATATASTSFAAYFWIAVMPYTQKNVPTAQHALYAAGFLLGYSSVLLIRHLKKTRAEKT